MSIEAMKLALEALTYCEALSRNVEQQKTQAITALRAAIEQAEKQEPVAWLYDWWDESEDLDGVPIGGEICDWITKDYDEAHSPTNGCHNIRPLYTAPPQRSWQGLTDEEVRAFEVWLDDEEEKHGWNPPQDIIKYIEAKLKEKNNG